MIPFLFIFSDWGILILRLVLGVILLRGSLPKIKNPNLFIPQFEERGLKLTRTRILIAGIIGSLAGFLLILGLFTQLVAFFISLRFVLMTIKFAFKPEPQAKEKELIILILAAALALLTLGGSDYSLDHHWSIYLF